MRKLYLSVLLILVPTFLYLLLFFTHDPYGYFQRDPDPTAASLTENMLDFCKGNYDAVILGDSRMMQFDHAHINKLNACTGHSFKNMSFDGAVAEEMPALFYWCEKQKPDCVKSVILVTGWYGLNTLLQTDRVEQISREISNPLNYAFSLDSLRAIFTSKSPESLSPVSDAQKRQNFELHLGSMSVYLQNYEMDSSALDDLTELCRYCSDHGIEIMIVLPPWWTDFYRQLENCGQLAAMDGYKYILSEYAPIYDLEYPDCPLSSRYEDFSDYAHFHGSTYEDFCDVLISGALDYARFWQGGKING